MDDMTTDTSPARRETSPSTSATSTTSTTSTSQTWTWSPTRLIADSAYLLVGFPLYLAAFIPIVVLLAVGGATMILAVGVPVVIAGLALARGTAAVERALQRSLLGARLPEPVVVAHPRDPGVVGQVTSLFRDRQRWGDAVFSLLAWAPTCVFWSVALSWWVTILAGLSYPAWQRYLPEDQLGDGMATWLNLPDEYWAHALCNVALGLMLLALAPIAMRGLARAQAGVNGWLLEAPTRTLRLEQAHRRQLADTREGELGSLQRLERDIHDGAQQRLVRLQMDLARAERQWDRAPEAARGLLASATEQAHVALDDLRAATRGIAPPVLLDRGLAAALEELAGRAAIPTRLSVDVPRVNLGYETALYFCVTEALANAAKHASATRVDVRVHVDGPWVVAEVEDDGVGGAHLGKGTGLAGLDRRLAGLGGHLTVTSPQGGPTVIRAEVPCVS